jgi:heptosyltransferase III
MTLIQKMLNFKKSITYHKFMVSFDYNLEVLKLLLIKFFTQKAIVVIILPEHIGDLIAFSPFAEKLKKESENIYIAWLVKPSYLEIIAYNKFIDYCIPITCDGFVEKFSTTTLFKIYDVRFNGNNVCIPCESTRKYGKIDEKFNLNNYYEYGSLLEIFSAIAQKPMKKEDWQPKITIPLEIENIVKGYKLPENYIVIHCTSNDPTREWQNDKWIELISKIIFENNFKVVQIGIVDKLHFKNKNYYDFCGKLSLIETAEVIKKSKIFIGIDSGPAHIANAVGAKSVILLGKYREIVNYMPFSGNFANGINAKIIYNSKIECSEIEIAEVLTTLQLLLNQIEHN